MQLVTLRSIIVNIVKTKKSDKLGFISLNFQLNIKEANRKDSGIS